MSGRYRHVCGMINSWEKSKVKDFSRASFAVSFSSLLLFSPLACASFWSHDASSPLWNQHRDLTGCFEKWTSATELSTLALVLCFGYKNSLIGLYPTKVRLCWKPMPVFMTIALIGFSVYRNDWEPPDKKVDTRKYRAEPKSIYEYQPGKSSVLTNEKMVMCMLKFFCLTLPVFFNPDALCGWIIFIPPWDRLALFRRQWKNEVFLPFSLLQVFIK